MPKLPLRAIDLVPLVLFTKVVYQVKITAKAKLRVVSLEDMRPLYCSVIMN